MVQAKAKAAQMEALKCREKLRMSQKEAWLWLKDQNELQDGPAVMETAEGNGTPSGSTVFSSVLHDVKESL